MDAARRRQDGLAAQIRAAQEMIDPGRQRGDPFQVLRVGDQPVIDRDAEREQHVDGGEIDRNIRRGRRLVHLDAGKPRVELALVDVGELFQDEDLGGHDSPSRRTALLTQMSARTLSVERHRVDEVAGLVGLLERIVRREHHPVGAERADRAGERLGRAHARRRHRDVLLDVLRRRLLELDAVELGAAVEPPQQERQRLAEMAERHLGAREAVEQAAEHQPQRVRPGLEAPFPGGAPQPVVAVERRRRRDRIGRVDVDRRAQRLGALPERMQRRDDRDTARWCGR